MPTGQLTVGIIFLALGLGILGLELATRLIDGVWESVAVLIVGGGMFFALGCVGAVFFQREVAYARGRLLTGRAAMWMGILFMVTFWLVSALALYRLLLLVMAPVGSVAPPPAG